MDDEQLPKPNKGIELSPIEETQVFAYHVLQIEKFYVLFRPCEIKLCHSIFTHFKPLETLTCLIQLKLHLHVVL